MANERTVLIPHFHGVNFSNAGITNADRKRQFFADLKAGNYGYYSEMALRNAILKFGEEISIWKRRILEEYYTADIAEAFSIIGERFYAFQQQYVNTYKSGKDQLDKDIQNLLSSHPVLRDLWFLSPESKAEDKKMSDNRAEYAPLKGVRTTRTNNARERREALDDAYNRLERAYQNARKDPFVAMSKLPRHAIEFSYKSENRPYDKTNGRIHFLGMVLVSSHSPTAYKDSAHYDVLSNQRAKDVKINAHYQYQTEVEFLKTHPFVVFPIIVPEPLAHWTRETERQYGLNQEDFNELKVKVASRKSEDGRLEEVKKWYSAYMIRTLPSKVRNGTDLRYVKADGTLAPFTGDVMTMQADIMTSATPGPTTVDRSYAHTTRRARDYAKEAVNNAKEADRAIKAVLSTVQPSKTLSTTTARALSKLRNEEKTGLESFETISLDRMIAVENPNLSREQRDELLAKELGKIESSRGKYVEGMKR